MEVTTIQKSIDVLPSPEHPNYRLWSNYAEFARDRGSLVTQILKNELDLQGAKILDIGCGAGGTSLALAEHGADVMAIDFNEARVQKFKKTISDNNLNIKIEFGNAQMLDFETGRFDCIILQDVIEHLQKPEIAIKEIARVLRPGGTVYVSTPNRWSPLNFVCDPHWNLPVVSVLPRKWVGWLIVKLVRREKHYRADFAELLSLGKIKYLFTQNQFELKLVNSNIAKAIFEKPTSVINSDFHINTIGLLKKLKLHVFIQRIVNDKFGFFNYCINPTWYLVARKP